MIGEFLQTYILLGCGVVIGIALGRFIFGGMEMPDEIPHRYIRGDGNASSAIEHHGQERLTTNDNATGTASGHIEPPRYSHAGD